MKPNKNYTPAGRTSKFSSMWHWTNIATDPRNSYKKKLVAIWDMEEAFDEETREHFLAALREVLRSAYSSFDDFTVRMKAIDALAQYGNWDDVEWTFWLHEQREFVRDEELKRMAYHRRIKEGVDVFEKYINSLEEKSTALEMA